MYTHEKWFIEYIKHYSNVEYYKKIIQETAADFAQLDKKKEEKLHKP